MRCAKILTCLGFALALSACDETNLEAVSGLTSVADSSADSSSSQAEDFSSASNLSSVAVEISSDANATSSASAFSSAANSSSSVLVSSSSAKSSSSGKSSSSVSKSSSSVAVVTDITGSCAPEQDTIVKGKKGKWIFTPVDGVNKYDLEEAQFNWVYEGTYEGKASGEGKTEISGTYPKTGTFTATVSINKGAAISCSDLVVRPRYMTGCECSGSVSTSEYSGSVATWRLENCVGEDGAGLAKVTWSSDVTSNGWTEASATLSVGQSLAPTVIAANGDGYEVKVVCQELVLEN